MDLEPNSIFKFPVFCENGRLCRGERPHSSVSSAVLVGSRGLTPERGLWGAPVCGREPQQHRQSCRTCGISSSQQYCLVFSPVLPFEQLSDTGLPPPPPPPPPVHWRAVSVGHAGCHVHVKPPCAGVFLSPLIPSVCSVRPAQAGIAKHALVWGGPFCNAPCCCRVSPVTCRACSGGGGTSQGVHRAFIMMPSCSVFQ